MAEFAAIPLFTDSWIADTGHLTRAERGLYMDLLILIWRSPECRVPNDLALISRRLMVTESEVEMLKSIIAEFCTVARNWLTQKRLKREWDFTVSKRDKNIAAAKSRWNKGKDTCERTTKQAMQTQSERNAPSPSPSVKEREANASPKKAVRGTRISADWTAPADWIDWAVSEGLTAPAAQRETERFRDYWVGKPGKDGVKADWKATWRNWVRKAIDQQRPANRQAMPQVGERKVNQHGQTIEFAGEPLGWVKVFQ